MAASVESSRLVFECLVDLLCIALVLTYPAQGGSEHLAATRTAYPLLSDCYCCHLHGLEGHWIKSDSKDRRASSFPLTGGLSYSLSLVFFPQFLRAHLEPPHIGARFTARLNLASRVSMSLSARLRIHRVNVVFTALRPTPYEVRVTSKTSLFQGKLADVMP